MHSSQWINGQYHSQVGQPVQTSQLTALLVGSPNNSQYRLVTAGVSDPQSAHFTPHNGVYSTGQTIPLQASTVPQQAVSSQQASTGGRYYKNLNFIPGNTAMQTYSNTQSGSPTLPTKLNCVPQISTQQVLHQNSLQNSSNQTAPNIIQANTIYLLKEIVSNINQQLPMYGKQPIVRQDNYFVHSASTAASIQHAQMPCTGTSVSATTHSKQTHNQNHSSGYRVNGTQHGFCPHPTLPTQIPISQPFRKNSHSITSNSSSGQFLRKSDMCQESKKCRKKATLSSHYQANPMGSQYETSHNLLKLNNHPINGAAGTGQHLLNSQMIPGNTDNLRQSLTAGSDCLLANNNAVSVLPVSSTQYNLEAPPPYCSVPEKFYVTVSKDGHGTGFKANNLFFLGDKLDNAVLSKTLHGSLSNDASQLQQLSETISPQRNKAQSPVASNAELYEKLVSRVRPNDCSDLTSHGHAGQKVVAVVQPLLQENHQVASKQVCSEMINHQCNGAATDKFVSKLDKFHISTAFAKDTKSIHVTDESNSGSNKISNQTRVKASLNMDSEPPSSGTVMASSDSAEPEDLSPTPLHADDTESQLSNKKTRQQCGTPNPQQSLTTEVPVSQNSEMNKIERPKDANANDCELSSVPIIPWTIDKLTMLIEEASKVQMQSEDFPKIHSTRKLLSTFWENDHKKLLNALSTGCYYKIMFEVKDFWGKHITSDSVVLSQVLHKSWSQLQESFHVLKHDYVHAEVPYTSSWLNIDEQLDDIDKEFGFPWSLKYCLDTSDNQPKLSETVSGIPAQIEMQNEALPQTELESDGEKVASGVEDSFTQTSFPNSTTKADSSDPYCSFEIQVLPPDEAKIVFDQVQSEMLKSKKTDNQSENFMNGSVEDEFPEMTDVKSNEVQFEKRAESPIQEFCCITRWMEMILGSNELSDCQCKQDPSPKDGTGKSLEYGQKEKPCMIGLGGKLDTTMEDKNKANADKTMDNEPLIPTWPDQCTEMSNIIDLTEDNDDIPHSYTNMEAKDVFLPTTRSSQSSSSMIELLEKQIENLSSRESEIAIKTSVHDCGQAHLKPTDPETLLTVNQGQTHISLRDESKHTAADEEDKVSYFISSSLDDIKLHSPTLKKTLSLDGERIRVGKKRKRLKAPDRIFPLLKKAKKCKDPASPDSQPALEGIPIVDANDFELIDTNVRTVKLALFGSSQRECVLRGCGKSHMSSPENLSHQAPMPPDLLFVNVSSCQRSPPETVPVVACSVKRRIHEDRKKSFPPSKMKRRNKLFAQNSTIHLKKTETVGPTDREKFPVSSKKPPTGAVRTKQSLSLSRRKCILNALKLRMEKSKNSVISPEPVNHMRSKYETRSHAITPLQEKNILRFSVLPNTFNFKDGPTGRNEKTDSLLSMPDLGTKDKSSKMTVKQPRGAWAPNPEKKYSPVPRSSSPVPKTATIFHEFQKKYKQKTQPSKDK